MRAEINEHGLLTITPETPTEEWALKCWTDKAFFQNSDHTRDKELMYVRGSMIMTRPQQPSNVMVTHGPRGL